MTRALLLILLATLLFPTASLGQDSISVANVQASSSTVNVPIYVRDRSGTALGADQASGSRIQALSFRISWSPASAISSASISLAGITSSVTPISEIPTSGPGWSGLIVSFDESTNRIPFNLDRAAPGDQVAVLRLQLSPSAVPGSSVGLSFDTANTLLSNQAGTVSERVSSGTLQLNDGTVTVAPLTLSLSPSSVSLRVGSSTLVNAMIDRSIGTSVRVNLSSTNSAVASFPSSVTIPAGARSATFSISASAEGSTTVAAALDGSDGSGSRTLNVSVLAPIVCDAPGRMVLSAPSEALSDGSYALAWSPVTASTTYEIEESLSSSFTSPSTRTINTSPATFVHTVSSDTTYYYRGRARNFSSDCNVNGDYSETVAVLVKAPPKPVERRVIPIVGSTPGAAGSYFRTAIQLYNAGSSPIRGALVFHPQGAAGSESDPSFDYELAPGEVAYYRDFLEEVGYGTGLGSLDVVAEQDQFPVSVVRIFNDGGASGTTGMTQEQLTAAEALAAGDRGILLAPPDPVAARFNIGLRTLQNGASFTISVRGAGGAVLKSIQASRPATYFTQTASADLLELVLTGNEVLQFDVHSGELIVYGSTTDNTTHDPSLQIARKTSGGR